MQYGKARLGIYTLAGIYVLFMAWNMWKNIGASTGNEYYVVLAASIAFLVIGLGIIIACTYKLFKIQDREWKNAKEESKN